MNVLPTRGSHENAIGEFLTRTASGAVRAASARTRHPAAEGTRRPTNTRFSETLASSLNRTADSKTSGDQYQIQSVEEGATASKSGKRPLATIAAFRYEEVSQQTKPSTGTDPFPGPSITREQWTEELLTADLSQETLHDVQDPAGLLNARAHLLDKPTDAEITDSHSGRSWPLNPGVLSTMEQALKMKERLEDLGIDAGEITESVPKSGPFGIDYGSDDRRIYQIGELNVASLLRCYAKNTKEFADQRVLDEWKAITAA